MQGLVALDDRGALADRSFGCDRFISGVCRSYFKTYLRAKTTDGIVVVQCVVVDDRAALLCVCEQRCVRKRCVRERVYCESRAEFG